MKLRHLFIAGLVSLVVTVCLGAQLGNGLFGGGQVGPQERKPGQGLELIDDSQLRKTLEQDVGRFQVVKLAENGLLLDSRTGDSWVLTADEKQQGKLSWVEVPRVRAKDGDKPAEKFEGGSL